MNVARKRARRAQVNQDPGVPRGDRMFTQVCYEAVVATVPKIPDAEFVNDDEICMQCHEDYAKTFANNVHRGGGCESCHGPASKHVETRGKEPGLIFSFKHGDPAIRAEACLRCHEQNQCTEGSRWRTSKHAHCGVTCVDCHRGHYNVAPGTPATKVADAATWPDGRHGELDPAQRQRRREAEAALAARHVPSPWRDGAGNLLSLPWRHAGIPADRRPAPDLRAQRLQLHHLPRSARPDPRIDAERFVPAMPCADAPTMAWHSSIHNLNGLCCTDCHNPHPRACVPQVVDIYHSQVVRPKRLPMAVDEPYTCYKCHPKIYGLNALPSHHPIKEGKMVCSDCHDPHGQKTDNLKEATVNLVCYKCHAEKQGPFAFEHPPVRENCAICHNPHGAVANNLLKQPPTFLCLRCHAGHNTAPVRKPSRLCLERRHGARISGGVQRIRRICKRDSIPIAPSATRRSTARIGSPNVGCRSLLDKRLIKIDTH